MRESRGDDDGVLETGRIGGREGKGREGRPLVYIVYIYIY